MYFTFGYRLVCPTQALLLGNGDAAVTMHHVSHKLVCQLIQLLMSLKLAAQCFRLLKVTANLDWLVANSEMKKAEQSQLRTLRTC
jgi:hypothetical protein